MNEIYLIRHGETEWNAQGRFQGKLDSALTETGVRQAEAIGKRLAGLDLAIDVFVISLLGRTRQTAAIIARSPSRACQLYYQFAGEKRRRVLCDGEKSQFRNLYDYSINPRTPR